MASRRAWLPFVLVLVCVAAEMVLAGTIRDASARPALITAIAGLAAIAVAVSLFGSMELRREVMGLRMVVLAPILLSLALAAVLMLETHFHAAAQLPGGAG